MTVEHTTEGIIPSVSIAAMLMRRDALIQRITETQAAYERMHEASTALIGGVSAEGVDFDLALEWTRTRRSFDGPESIEQAIKRVDARCWSVLLEKSGLKQMMDQQARAEWSEQIEKLLMPEFTEFTDANIRATFERLGSERDEIFERGVENVFRKLSFDYKTNTPVKFGKRLVVTYASERFSWRSQKTGKLETRLYGPTHDFAAKLDDLVRAFCVLEGKPEPSHDRGAYATLSRGAWMKDGSEARDAELHGYLKFRGYKNGNAHLTFLRMDLVDQLNRILAKRFPHALPPS